MSEEMGPIRRKGWVYRGCVHGLGPIGMMGGAYRERLRGRGQNVGVAEESGANQMKGAMLKRFVPGGLGQWELGAGRGGGGVASSVWAWPR